MSHRACENTEKLFCHFFFTLERDAIDDDTDDGINHNKNLPSNAQLHPIHIDTSYYYRLKNKYSGPHLALDVINDGSNYGLKMTPVSGNTGQFWRFVDLGDNVYSLRNRFLQNEYSLDIINDGTKTTPHMAKTGDYTGQRWHLARLNDGTAHLSNQFTRANMLLDVFSNTHVAHMSPKNVDYSGQHWSFVKIGKMEDY